MSVILVPFDFTEVANCAVDHAANIAKDLEIPVVLLHIINKDTRELLNVYKVTNELVNEKLQEKVDEFSNKYGVPFEYEAREGSIFSDIAEASEDHNAFLVVMGTHGRHGIQNLFGSYARRVITSSKIPFIVVQKRLYRPYKIIVTPLDDTLESRQKIKWAIYVSKLFDATIHLKVRSDKIDPIYPVKIRTILSKVEQLFKANDVKYIVDYKEDEDTGSKKFAEQVIEYAHSIDADLILIMTDPDHVNMFNFILKPEDEIMLFNDYEIPVMAINPRDLNFTYVGF
ncbi:MAG: universal stress protein [Bacteroidales bacterium]